MDDPASEQHGIARLHDDGAKLTQISGIRQIVKQAESRRDHQQAIRVLMNMEREVFRARRKTQMHEAIVAIITGAPYAPFDTRIVFESSINADWVRLTKPIMG